MWCCRGGTVVMANETLYLYRRWYEMVIELMSCRFNDREGISI